MAEKSFKKPLIIIDDFIQNEEWNQAAIELDKLFTSMLTKSDLSIFPEFIKRVTHPKVLKDFKLVAGFDVPSLIRMKGFLKALDTNLWNLIPEEYKKIKTVKPVEWKADPKDEGLISIVKDFVGVDNLREAMSGANFDAEGIVATDAHKLIFLDKVSKGKKGIYCVTKKCFDTVPNKEGYIETNNRFPDYVTILPKKLDIIFLVNANVLRRFAEAISKARFHHSVSTVKDEVMTLRYEKDKTVYYCGISLHYIKLAMATMSKLGYEAVDIGFLKDTNPNEKVVFIAPKDKLNDALKLKAPFILLMPVKLDERILTPPKGILIFDLSTSEIITTGIKEKIDTKLGTVNSKPETKKTSKERNEEATIVVGVWNVFYYDKNGEVMDITQIDEKDEELAWSLFEEFGHERKEGDYLDFVATTEEVDAETAAEITSEQKADSLSLLTGGAWFLENPVKVLGKIFKAKDKFGKEVEKVKGTMEDVIQGIDVPSVEVTEDIPQALEQDIKEPVDNLTSDKTVLLNIKKSIIHTKKLQTEELKKKTSGKKSDEGCEEGYHCFEDVIAEYNKGISEEEIRAWVWYKRKYKLYNNPGVILKKDNGWNKYVLERDEEEKALEKWLEEGIICFSSGGFLPSVLYYAENIYDRISQLLSDKEEIIKQFGQKQFDRQLEGLEKVKPPKLTLANPDADKRLYINPVSDFAKEVEVKRLTDGTNFRTYDTTIEKWKDSGKSLQEAFIQWMNNLPKNEFAKSTDRDIEYYFLKNMLPPRRYSKEEKLRIKQNAKMEGTELFSKFLAEGISRDDQLAIEQLWNRKYNSYVAINYFKIPIAFTCSNTFKNKPLFIRPTQREGLGFLSANGSGCIAFDVGLGKTMTAILSIAQAFESGECKRPLIVVPNQTYDNWLKEIGGSLEKDKIILTGLLPQYEINDLYNLGADYLEKLTNKNGQIQKVPEYSITVMTYEGFNRLGFGEKTWNEIGGELYAILNQGTESVRESAQLEEKIATMMGKGLKGGLTEIEELGFDYLVIDEAHAAKKSFTKVKGEVSERSGKRERSRYQIYSGEPSAIGLKAFMISQYILRNNGMKNTVLLTATPFTNSPLEIFSILALIAYQQLEKWGIKNIKHFFDDFIKSSFELVINAKLRPERKEIILGFNNLISLQKLIFKFILYKTGEEANIQRPNKIVIPLLNKIEGEQIIPLPPEEQISASLPMTQDQKQFMSDIEYYITGKTSLTNFCVNLKGTEEETEQTYGGETLDEKNLSDEEEDGARTLRGLSFARQLALSPYLYACNPAKEPTFEEYINTSPKLKYVMGCIESVKAYHESKGEEVSGQVIYMNAGVHYFPLIRDYLIKQIGFKENEVGIIKGGMNAARKESIKEKFLSGAVKVIIGSSTIKEGINLQNKASVLYNLWLDWNPTDVKQLEGRVWRFGNQYANVRIVVPLMENSIDTFIFQKLEEKTSRINEIWQVSGKSNSLKLEEFNPAELKMGLVTDPYALADLLLLEERERIEDEIKGLQNKRMMLEEIDKARTDYNNNIETIKKTVNSYKPPQQEAKVRTQETVFKIYKDYLEDEKTDTTYQEEMLFDTVRKASVILNRGIKEILEPRGLDIHFNYTAEAAKFDKEIEQLNKTLEEYKGEKAIENQAQEIIKEREQSNYQSKSVKEQVSEFASMNPKLLSSYMTYGPEEEIKTTKKLEKAEALETSADSLQDIEQLVEVMEEMASIMDELNKIAA